MSKCFCILKICKVFSFVYMCMYVSIVCVRVSVCVCMHACTVCAYAHGGQRSTSGIIPQSFSTLFIGTRSLPGQGLLTKLGRLELAIQLQGSVCLHLPSTGMQGWTTRAYLWSPQLLGIELRLFMLARHERFQPPEELGLRQSSRRVY